MKKIIKALMAFVMVLTLVSNPLVSKAAEALPTLELNYSNATQTTLEVVLPVGVLGSKYEITYDSTKLKMTNSIVSETMAVACNTGEPGKIIISSANATPTTAKLVLATFKFSNSSTALLKNAFTLTTFKVVKESGGVQSTFTPSNSKLAVNVTCPHTNETVKTTLEPTFTTTGKETRTCKKCGNVKTVTLPKLEEKTYTITYKLNNGTNSTNNPTTYTNRYGCTFENPTRTGFTFNGWYTDSAFTSTPVTSLEVGHVGNVTLYAKWTANKYSVTFNGNGSTGGSTAKMTGLAYATYYTVPNCGFTKTGYVFKEWNKKADGSGTSYLPGTEFKNLSSKEGGSITLYAIWEKATNKEFTVTFKNGDTVLKTETVKYGQCAIGPEKLPTKTGFDFDCWYSNGVKFDLSQPVTSDMVLTGSLTPHHYTVTFKPNGSASAKMPSLTKVEYMVYITLPVCTYTWTGYDFIGWSKSKDGSTKIYQPGEQLRNLTSKDGGTVNFYAQWNPHRYTLKFIGNGHTGGSTAAITDIAYNEYVTIPACGHKKTGYTFVGWNKKADGSGTMYQPGDEAKNFTNKDGGTVSLYAIWKKN